ncbi:HAMP domain-containing sensor histidine kinase [Clostridium sp. JS66]|uniref:HAMP domain-containing sensor histidine kinase n=1 Tax=Clostridium sp. JS66 TaxID=3064705 RepID=UPI00298E4E96|nr:HAMP domain-containing sensor histidine kinase [Clostridium sp. JS66]WPC44008.1 HAMP domain-containing sensor histidine kinase [Clostridium sp. JS66]
MKFSIRYKFGIGLFLIFGLSFNIMCFFMNKIILENNKKVIKEELSVSQKDLNIYVKQYLSLNKIDNSKEAFEENKENIGSALNARINDRVVLYNLNGNMIFDSSYNNGKIYDKDDYEDLKLALKDKSAYKIEKINDRYMAVFSEPIYVDKKLIGVIRYTKDYTELFISGIELLKQMEIFMIVIFSIIFIFSLLLTTKITTPIIKLTKITKEISSGNFDIGINLKSHDEVGELVENFSKMKDKIKNQIETIKKDRDNLRKLERYRKDFFDTVTHEMKTPLTIIDGYTQMILDEGNSDTKLLFKAASKIKKESNKLHNMIIEVLQISKSESNISSEKMEQIDMKKVLNAVCDDMLIKAKKYEINIVKELEEHTYILANKDDVIKIVINIIDNSIKYGNVRSLIKVKLFKENKFCVMTVEDEGKGISKEDLNKIFKPFYRANKEKFLKREGSGLGLFIVRSLVESYKGTINIESIEGKGTKVYIKIPLFLQVGNNLVK